VEAAVSAGTSPQGDAKRPSTTLARLERELRELWSEPTAPGELPKTRVCTMNLVVVARGEELATRYTKVVDEVTASIPARAIVLALESGGSDADAGTLDGDVSAVCSIDPDGKQAVCSERVRLIAKGLREGPIASAIEALLVPELPTNVVWVGPDANELPLVTALGRDAQRVVLDSEYASLSSAYALDASSEPQPSQAPAAALPGGEPEGPGHALNVVDLAWTRLSAFREMCARFFDDPAVRLHAFGVRRVSITQASASGAPLGSPGALLLAWLSTALGWKASWQSEAFVLERNDGGRIALELNAVPKPKSVAPNALASVMVEAEEAGVVLTGTLARDLASALDPAAPEADVLVWRLETTAGLRVEQRVRLGANRGARLLERTLRRPKSDAVLDEAMRFARAASLGKLRCR
jgi:glucose-6-phosphate dehydrogenase assembly protein OpcA